MDIQAQKSDIIKWLERVNDNRIIRQFMLLKESAEQEIKTKLSKEERDFIAKGLESIQAGRTKSNEEVAESTRKKYPQLFK
ncbi:MAG: hypothetical protein KF845_14980 [Cyclobacteriaceae bacterium]|nr:hypothetical protein [Cyclobacteriaceae bacterium]